MATHVPRDILARELQLSCEHVLFEPLDVVGQIQELRREGVRCVIATDNMDTFRAYTVPALQLDDLFDDILVSNERGVLKFDVERERGGIPFFDEYLQVHGLTYQDVLLIDDCIDDGFYARVGFTIVQVKTPQEVTAQLASILSTVRRTRIETT